MLFQKISIPPPQKVTGNSEGEGGLKAEISKGSGGGFMGSSFSRGKYVDQNAKFCDFDL